MIMEKIKISVVVNTFNEEKNLARCLSSVKDFADEIVVVDMHSADKTVEIAKKYKAKIFSHEYTRYVEPARNFALQKATGDWTLLLDADEELPFTLKEELKKIVSENRVDFVKIPRKNIIFNKWIQYSRWWPDYLIRFFKKGKVVFTDKIHQPPATQGEELILQATEQFAIVHHNFQSIGQYFERLNRYSDVQSEGLIQDGYEFNWHDLVLKPNGEFLSRYFAGEGYKDGLHGLILSLLQGISEFAVYAKVWEKKGFKEESTGDFNKLSQKVIGDFLKWQVAKTSRSIEKIRLKIKAKI